jgi:Zn-finger nucleic acid-binding protein
MIEEVKIDQCLQCEGIWFDQDELRKAKDTVEPDLTWYDFEIWRKEDQFGVQSSSILCPRCQVPLVAIEYGGTGVEIDYCAQCEAVWLDGGEFEGIIAALGEEIAGKDVPDYVAASLEEARELVGGEEGAISEWRDFLTVVRLLQYRVLAENPRLREVVAALQKGATGF